MMLSTYSITSIEYNNRNVSSSFTMKKVIILCVSLKNSIERQEKILTQITNIQKKSQNIRLDFEFFEAIYGKSLRPEYLTFLNISRKIAGLCTHELGPGEIGCFLSHMILWQRHVNGVYKDYDRVIIIEDDVILNSLNFYEKLNSLIISNPPFAFLGGHTEPSRTRIRGYSSADGFHFNMTGPRDLYTSTYAYSLTPETAQKFIYKQIKCLSFIDNWKFLLAGKMEIPFFYCFEHDEELISSISDDRKKYTKKPNRFKKNFNKMKNDLFSRIISLFLFKKIIRLSEFIKNE